MSAAGWNVPRSAAAMLIAAVFACGCVSTPVGLHQPSLESVQLLRASGIVAVNVGDFDVAPGSIRRSIAG